MACGFSAISVIDKKRALCLKGKRGATMWKKMKDGRLDIYYYLERNGIECSSVREKHFKKGEMIAGYDEYKDDIFYVNSGITCIEILSTSGRKIVLDEIPAGEFSGHLSNRRGYNFYCNVVALENCSILVLTSPIMDKLMEDSEFAKIYYEMTSRRLYDVLKKSLMNRAFSQYESIGYFIWKNRENGKFVPKVNFYKFSSLNNISRRNLYNILKKMEEDGIIARESVGGSRNIYHIINEKSLEEITESIRRFMENEY